MQIMSSPSLKMYVGPVKQISFIRSKKHESASYIFPNGVFLFSPYFPLTEHSQMYWQLQCRTKVLGQFSLYPPPPPPITMLMFNTPEKRRLVYRWLEYFDIVWGEGGSKKCSKRTRCVEVIRIEMCIVKCFSFCPSFTSFPRSYDLHCMYYGQLLLLSQFR